MNTFKRKWLYLGAAFAALLISGCSGDQAFLKAQADAAIANGNARVEEARAAAEQARAVQALAAKVDAGGASAYLIATAMKGLTQPQQGPVMIQPPRSFLETAWTTALQVADIALRGYGIKAGRDTAIAATNASRDTAIASYGAFTTMGGHIATAGTAGYPYIQAPGAVTTNTISGSGVIGDGTYTVSTTTTRNCNGGTGATGGDASGGTGTPGTAGPGGGAAGGNC